MPVNIPQQYHVVVPLTYSAYKNIRIHPIKGVLSKLVCPQHPHARSGSIFMWLSQVQLQLLRFASLTFASLLLLCSSSIRSATLGAAPRREPLPLTDASHPMSSCPS